MLVGHVSDERYIALPDVHVEFRRENAVPVAVRSAASGAVYAEIEPGE
jgi:hypothetical protein